MGLILRHKDEFWRGEIDVREQTAKSIKFMKEHLREPLRISTLAAGGNLSRSHYTTLFRRATGDAPLMEFNHRPKERPGQLLQTTNLAIKAICNQPGFFHPFYLFSPF